MNRVQSIRLVASVVLATGALNWSDLRAQTQGQTAPLPQFDVASIRQNKLGEQPSNNWRLTPGRTDFHNSQVFELIKSAFGDYSLRVEGGPGWILSDRFDVVVQYPIDTPGDTRTLMLRALLIDRFKLAAHLDPRETPIYSLVLARPDRQPGPKLEPAVAECAPTGRSNPPAQCRQGGGPGLIHFDYIDMASLARNLSARPAVGRPVVNNTGLTGPYKIDVRFTPAQPLSATPSATGAPTLPPINPGDPPDIFGALEEQLGLKLEGGKALVPVLVIDHIESPSPD